MSYIVIACHLVSTQAVELPVFNTEASSNGIVISARAQRASKLRLFMKAFQLYSATGNCLI